MHAVRNTQFIHGMYFNSEFKFHPSLPSKLLRNWTILISRILGWRHMWLAFQSETNFEKSESKCIRSPFRSKSKAERYPKIAADSRPARKVLWAGKLILMNWFEKGLSDFYDGFHIYLLSYSRRMERNDHFNSLRKGKSWYG